MGIHYPTRSTATIDAVDGSVLAAAAGWVDAATLHGAVAPRVGVAAYEASLRKLFAARHLLHEGSEEERLDAAVRDRWPWGHAAAFYQLSVRDPGYLPSHRAAELLRWRYVHQPQVPLTGRAAAPPETVALPAPDRADALFRTLFARRSHRAFATTPLALGELAGVLAAGLAITGWARAGHGEGADDLLPLKPAPSGGARNPYEGYVAVRAVEGLAPGLYHYDGVAHRLGRLGDATPPSFSRLLGGQEWFDDAAAAVFLVACFERTAWKYPHPTAYRVVLLEAGHVAQNLLLAAAAAGLAAAPTAALHDGAVEAALGLEPPLRAAVYAVALGRRGDGRSVADFRTVTPNPVFA